MDLFGGGGAAGCGTLQVPKGELVLRVRSLPRHRISSLIPWQGRHIWAWFSARATLVGTLSPANIEMRSCTYCIAASFGFP